MGKVFGHDPGGGPSGPSAHRLDAELDSIINALYDDLEPPGALNACLGRSVAINLRHDDRVPESRAGSFRETVDGYRAINPTASLQDCSEHYFQTKVRGQGEFLKKVFNSDNFREKNPTDVLVTVVNLSKIYSELQIIAGWEEYSDRWTRQDWSIFNTGMITFPAPDSRSEYPKWLKWRLSPENHPSALRTILKGLAIYGETAPYRPRWVTMWNFFQPYIADPDRWGAVLGTNPPQSGDWLVLLAYQAKDVSRLCRPTQIDTRWSGYHFPSPGEISECGHPMEIEGTDGSRDLLAEYIHDEIPPSFEQWEFAGSIPPHQIESAVAQSPDGHRQDRRLHWRRLYRKYPGQIMDWMAPFQI